MENKFNKGDIVYSIYVDEYLIVNINKLVVDSFFFNNLPQYNKFIYSCKGGLEQMIIRDFELPLTQDEIDNKSSMFSSIRDKRNPGATIHSSTTEDSMYLKEEVEGAIQTLLEERREMNKRADEAAEKFRCPLTGGKMKLKEEGHHIMLDGPDYYKVEGSDIIWEKWQRAGEIYETEQNNVKHEFVYLGDGKWKNKN